ncbi:MAG TPA: ABC transporter permease [Candidatus Binatia bacterium]|nr:ABC transporter permease [Candidatus Binatia bacterium]
MNALEINTTGLATLTKKEVKRFWNVLGQTVTAPVITALLYLLVFAHVLSGRAEVYPGVSYPQFLVPGLIMMSVIQNAFANSSSSLIQSKIMGNLVFVLMAPLAALELFAAYLAASLLRAGIVGIVLYLATWPFVHLPVHAPLALLGMFLLSGGALAVLGLIAAIVATKFDHLAAFQNFLILPMSFLSGVFYSIHSLPEFWRALSHLNPFFYMIDGFRQGFFGIGDVAVWQSLAWVGGFFALLSAVCLWMLSTGFRLRP